MTGMISPLLSEPELRRWIDGLPWQRLFWLALSVVTVLALMPWSEELPGPFRWSDKLNHFAAFTVLSLMCRQAYRSSFFTVVVWMTLYGAAIEAIQFFLPWRSAEWGDLGVDFIASFSGALIWPLFSRFRRPGPRQGQKRR